MFSDDLTAATAELDAAHQAMVDTKAALDAATAAQIASGDAHATAASRRDAAAVALKAIVDQA